MLKTRDIINEIAKTFSNENVKIEVLKTKADLRFSTNRSKAYLQFVENRYINETTHYFNAVFNIYIVGKSLMGTNNNSLYDFLDDIRGVLTGSRLEMLPYITKNDQIVIEAEKFTETQSDSFIYTVRFRLKIKNPKKR